MYAKILIPLDGSPTADVVLPCTRFLAKALHLPVEPFREIFGLPVYVDPALEKDDTTVFNAGNHQQTVRLKYRDFKEIVGPRIVHLSREEKSWRLRNLRGPSSRNSG